MITGDHRATAAAIARDLGLRGEAREGREIEGISGAAPSEMVEATAVFARVASSTSCASSKHCRRVAMSSP